MFLQISGGLSGAGWESSSWIVSEACSDLSSAMTQCYVCLQAVNSGNAAAARSGAQTITSAPSKPPKLFSNPTSALEMQYKVYLQYILEFYMTQRKGLLHLVARRCNHVVAMRHIKLAFFLTRCVCSNIGICNIHCICGADQSGGDICTGRQPNSKILSSLLKVFGCPHGCLCL